jgi:tetratricopeptide (TPR) repeat protein
MLLNALTLLLTGERGAVIGLGSGVLAIGLIVALSRRYSSSLRWASLVGILLLLVIPIAVYAARGTALVRWNTTLDRLSRLSPRDRSTRTRLITFGVSWRAFKARPLLGYGPELYTVASVRHFNPDILTYEQGWWDRSHNTLTDRLAMEGAIGLLAYLSIFVAAGLMLVKVFRLEPHGDLTVPITAGMLSAYFVQNLFIFDSPSSYLLFFATLAFVDFLAAGRTHAERREKAEQAKTVCVGARALAAAARRRATPPASGGRSAERFSSSHLLPRRHKVLISGLALLVLVTISKANLKGLAEASLGDELVASADHPQRFQELLGQTVAYGSWAQDEVVGTAADVLRAVGAGKPAYLPASAEVAAWLETQVDAHRNPDPRALIRLGSLYQAMAAADPTCLPKAEKVFQKAIGLAPKWPESYDGLGATYLIEGRVDEALALFKRAVEINPSNGTARWMYAFPLIWNHRAEGLGELEAALHNYDYHNRDDLKRLVNTYYQLHDLRRSIQFQLELTELEPGAAVHHATLARLYKESGDTNRALQEIRTAALLDPRYRLATGEFELSR